MEERLKVVCNSENEITIHITLLTNRGQQRRPKMMMILRRYQEIVGFLLNAKMLTTLA